MEIACAVPAAKILSVPDSIGLDVAQACLTQGLTAHYLTHDAHAGLIKEGELEVPENRNKVLIDAPSAGPLPISAPDNYFSTRAL